MSSSKLFQKKDLIIPSSSDDHWIPLSDLMTGLMMMFMLVAILFMVRLQAEANQMRTIAEKAESQSEKMRQIAVIYTTMRDALYYDLENEFKPDLPKWGAELDKNLVIRFKEPDVLFETGEAELKPRFKEILSDFFPRYIKILGQDRYKQYIEEIRIEGHTSSMWNDGVTGDDAYLLNMALSQERTRAALQYILAIKWRDEVKRWVTANLTANGLSSSKLRLSTNGDEDSSASQRVEFRVRTNADEQIAKLLEEAGR